MASESRDLSVKANNAFLRNSLKEGGGRAVFYFTTEGRMRMTRYEVLKEVGCTIGEAEIIGLKLDALRSDEERVTWIERHLTKFLAAIRAMETLRELKEQERIANAAMADLEAMVRAQTRRVVSDPYYDEARSLISLSRDKAFKCACFGQSHQHGDGWPSRDAIDARDAQQRRDALEREAEDALAQAVKLVGGDNGQC